MNIRTQCLASLLLLCGAQATPAADFDYFVTGNAADVQPAHTEGALMLMGGGGLARHGIRGIGSFQSAARLEIISLGLLRLRAEIGELRLQLGKRL